MMHWVDLRSGTGFRRGLLQNLSNPKASVAWMAILSLGVSTASGTVQIMAATGLCIALRFLISSGHALISFTRSAMQAYSRLRRWVDGSMVAAMLSSVGLGLIQCAVSR